MPKFSGKRKRSQIPHGGTKRVKTQVITVSKMAKMLKGELKSVDTSGFSLVPSTTMQAQLLNATIPGSTGWNRLGRKIALKSIALNIDLCNDGTGVTPGLFDHLRLVLVYDKQPNGAAPGWTDMFLTVNAAGGTSSTSVSHPNLNNKDRFKIVRDYQYKLGQGAGGAPTQANYPDHEYTGNKSPCQITDYISLKGLETTYNAGVAGTIADITTGSLYLFTFGISTAANATMSFKGETRLRYYDI